MIAVPSRGTRRMKHASESLARLRPARSLRNTRTTQDKSIIRIPVRDVLKTSCQGDVTVGRSEEVQTGAVSSAIVQSIMYPASERRLADRRFLKTTFVRPSRQQKMRRQASKLARRITQLQNPLYSSRIKKINASR